MTWVEGTVVVSEEGDPEAERTGTDAPTSEGNSNGNSGGGAMAALARRNRSSNDGSGIEQVDAALEADSQLIVLFIYANSEERKFARSSAASKAFEENVLGSFEVATALQGCANIRFDGTQMSTEIRKAYKLSSNIPQLVLIDINGKVLYKATASTTAANLAQMITAAKERVAKLISNS